MSTSRHPAGTSLGGQWAPGSASEVDDPVVDEAPAPTTDPASAEAVLRHFPDEDAESGIDDGLAGRLDRQSLTEVSEGLASAMNFSSAAHSRANPTAHPRYSPLFARAGEAIPDDGTDEQRSKSFRQQAQSYKALKSRMATAAELR